MLLLALFLAFGASFALAQTGAKGGKDATCDGALEVVPTKQVSFARKRRPAPVKPAPDKSAGGDAKRQS
jgi:hypothetical protein